MSTVDTIKQKYPLHFLVWNNDYMHLEQELAKNEVTCLFSILSVFQRSTNICIRVIRGNLRTCFLHNVCYFVGFRE